MRIAILSSFPPHALPALAGMGPPKGHYATWLPHLAVEFARYSTELDLHWIGLVPEPAMAGSHSWSGQSFHFLPTQLRGRASSLYRADRRALQARLDELKPDLVHGWGNEDVYGLAAALSGFRNLVGVQGLISYYVQRTRMHPRDWFQALIEGFVLRKAGHLVAESPWACRMASRHSGGRRVHRVEYGVQNLFQETRWTPDPGAPRAVFCGSADARKGIGDLVRAFRSPTLAQAQLRIVGDDSGREAARWKAASPPNVEWVGRRPIDECARLVGEGWCSVMPTRCDTGPMAVKEARVIGLPVISSPFSGAADYIEEGANGFLVRPGDIEALTDRLALLLSNLELCRRMGGHRHAEQRIEFSAAATANGFRALYQECVA